MLNIATTMIMISHRRAGLTTDAAPAPAPLRDESPVGRIGVVLITAAFVLLQATNATGMTILTVYVTETLRLDVLWAGIALGVNTRRIGSIVSGPIIAVGSLTVLGQRGIFVTSAALTLLGLLIIAIAGRMFCTDGTVGVSRR